VIRVSSCAEKIRRWAGIEQDGCRADAGLAQARGGGEAGCGTCPEKTRSVVSRTTPPEWCARRAGAPLVWSSTHSPAVSPPSLHPSPLPMLPADRSPSAVRSIQVSPSTPSVVRPPCTNRAPQDGMAAQMCDERGGGAAPRGCSRRQDSCSGATVATAGAGAAAAVIAVAVAVAARGAAAAKQAHQTSPSRFSWPLSPAPAPPKTIIGAAPAPPRAAAPRAAGGAPSQSAAVW